MTTDELRAMHTALTEALAALERSRGAYREAAEWIEAVQLHYVLGPEASPKDIFMVAAEQVVTRDIVRDALVVLPPPPDIEAYADAVTERIVAGLARIEGHEA